MNAAIYLRVSTADQHTENQRGACEVICAGRGWTPIVVEETASGDAARKGWQRVEAMAANKEIAAVVVWSLDRTGRSLFDVIDSVRRIRKAGARLVSVQEPWLDLDGDDGATIGNLLMMVFAWVADYERRRLIERTRLGVARAKRLGRIGGRVSQALVGEHLEAAIIARQDGKSWGEIQEMLTAREVFKAAPPNANEKQKRIPLPRNTIRSAVQRVMEFDGETPHWRGRPNDARKKTA